MYCLITDAGGNYITHGDEILIQDNSGEYKLIFTLNLATHGACIRRATHLQMSCLHTVCWVRELLYYEYFFTHGE